MALFKFNSFLQPSQDKAFDQVHQPGEVTPHAGIYRCETCGHEIVATQMQALPSEPHGAHRPSRGPIYWRLVVYAQTQTAAG